MTPELFDRVSKILGTHEGRVLSMYRDTKGNVTYGVGHASFCAADAAKRVWWKAVDVLATAEEVAREWDWVKRRQLLRGRLFLSYEETDVILLDDLAVFEKRMGETFPDQSTYPQPALVALYDIIFNCGSFEKWPRLVAAVRSKDWKTAAAQSNRPEVSAQRNKDINDLFLLASA